MAVPTRTKSAREELLARLRTRRRLPPPAERRRIREDAGVSVRQMAAALGVSPMAPVRWEQGATPRDPEHTREYAQLLEELRLFADEGVSRSGERYEARA